MIRSTTLTVGPALVQIAAKVYGLVVWAGSLSSAAFPLVAVVDAPAGPESVLLREGVYYQLDAPAESVSVVTADGSTGTLVVDIAKGPADFINLVAPSSAQSPLVVSQGIANPTTWPVRVTFARPAWAASLAIWARCYRPTMAPTPMAIYAIDSLGAVGTKALATPGVATDATLPVDQVLFAAGRSRAAAAATSAAAVPPGGVVCEFNTPPNLSAGESIRLEAIWEP